MPASDSGAFAAFVATINMAAVTSSGWRTFPDFNRRRSGRRSDLVPTTASRLNAYLAAYR